MKTAGVEVRSSSRTSTSTRNPRPTTGHPHSTRKNRLSGPGPGTPPASSMPSISSSSLATLQVRYVVASSKTRPVTAGAKAPPLLGPQSFARLAPQAHPMPTRTTPRGPLWGCVPSSSGLYRLFHVPSPSRHSRCSRGIVPLAFGPTLSRSYPSRDTTSTS